MKIKLLSSGYDDGIHRVQHQVFEAHQDLAGHYIRPLGDLRLKGDGDATIEYEPRIYFSEKEAKLTAGSNEIWYLPNQPVLHLKDSILRTIQI